MVYDRWTDGERIVQVCMGAGQVESRARAWHHNWYFAVEVWDVQVLHYNHWRSWSPWLHQEHDHWHLTGQFTELLAHAGQWASPVKTDSTVLWCGCLVANLIAIKCSIPPFVWVSWLEFFQVSLKCWKFNLYAQAEVTIYANTFARN